MNFSNFNVRRIAAFVVVLMLLFQNSYFSTYAFNSDLEPDIDIDTNTIVTDHIEEDSDEMPEPSEDSDETVEPPEDAGEAVEPSENIDQTFNLFNLFSTGPCAVTEYCTDEGCPCYQGGDPADCTCEDDCLCRTATLQPCENPLACTNTECLCETDPELCICGDECMCQWPSFSAGTKTEFANNSIKSGETTQVTVDFNLQSTDSTFSEVVIKTYIPQNMIPVNAEDIDGVFSYKTSYKEGDYTVIEVTGSAVGAFVGNYSFDVLFPAGITTDGAIAEAFTVIEGKIHEDGNTQGREFGEAQNSSIERDECEAIVDITTWNISLTNKDLDYKDPSNGEGNIFRLEADVSRAPAGDIGVEYLKASGTSITITLPGEAGNGLNVLRLTKADGTVIPASSYSIEGNVITFEAGNIPFNAGFTDGYTSATNAKICIVFELDKTYLEEIGIPVAGGFYEVDELKSIARMDYTLISGQTGSSEDVEKLQAIIYSPGKDGGGSIGKSANPYVEGETFFAATSAAVYTPIEYTIGYTNSSNTPVKNLVITDKRPLALTLSGGALQNASVPANSVFFTKITLKSWSNSADYYDGIGLSCMISKKIGNATTELGRLTVAGQSIVIDNASIDEIQIAFDGVDIELKHNFYAQFEISVAGEPTLTLDAATRNQINFIRNTVEFDAISSKDGTTLLHGSDSCLVHVRPYDNEEPPKVWRLSLEVSPDTNSQNFSTSAEIARGRDVYYRISVSPDDVNQFVYNPAFYLELPPDIVFQNIVSFTGFGNDNKLQGELIENPVGAGKLLKISVPAGDVQLLDPSRASSYIIVRGKVSAEAPQGASVSSRAFFGVRDSNTPLDQSKYTQDQYIPNLEIIDTSGFGNEPILLIADASVGIRSSGFIEGELWVQTEFDKETDAWHRHPEIAKALPGGLLTYKFVVRNGGSQAAENITLYNIFSHESDQYIIGSSSRDSKWKPYLTGPITLPAVIQDQATIYYSEYENHRVAGDGDYSGIDDWTTTPFDFPSVKAIKIVFNNDYVLPAHESLEIMAPMFAPVDFSVDPSDYKNNLAVSSLATVFRFSGAASLSALEPLKVMVQLVENSQGEISGMVWGDTNKDGKKTSLGAIEFPETGREVLLYVMNNSVWELKDSVPTDGEGQYKFTNLPTGTYQLRLELINGYEEGISGGGIDNQFIHVETGYVATDDIVIDTDNTRIFKNIDGGIVPPSYEISGAVWRSIDGSSTSERDITTPDRDVSMAGIKATLYRLTGGGDASGLPNKVEIDDTLTVDGTYTFTGVYSGRYIVVFDKPVNYSYAKRVDNAGGTAGKPTYAHHSQAAESSGNGQLAGQSYEIWIKDQNQTNIECGLVPEKGSISGTIWRDRNGNGVNDSEGGANGQSVTISSNDAYFPDGYNKTITVGAVGTYTFANLNPGTYTVTYADGTNIEYVSYCGSAIMEDSRGHSESYSGLVIDPAAGKLTEADRNFGLVQKLTISGSIFNDKKYNGAWDGSPDEKLDFDSTKLIVSRAANSGGDSTATAPAFDIAGGGDYSVTVWPGTYTVVFEQSCVSGASIDIPSMNYDEYLTVTPASVNAASFALTTRTWTVTMTSTGSPSTDNKPDVNLPLTRPRSIEGCAWLDFDGDATKGNDTDEPIMVDRAFAIAGVTAGALVKNDTTGYRFDGLYPGNYTVTVDLTGGYKITNASGANAPNTAGQYAVSIDTNDDLGPAGDPKGINFGLALPVTVAGTVWWDKDLDSDYKSDGIYGGGDELLALTNIAVLYQYDGSGYVPVGTGGTQSSNNYGVYAFTGLLPGQYQVVLSPNADTYFLTELDNAIPRTLPNNDPVTLDADETANKVTWSGIVLRSDEKIENLDLSVGKYATISGVIWHDLNGNGNKNDLGEMPLTTGETLVLSSGGIKIGVTTSAAVTGTYSFKVKPGLYSVEFKQGARRVTNSSASGFTVTESGLPETRTAVWTVDHDTADTLTYPEKDILLSIYSGISGNVWIDKNADGICDPAESPKTGASVTLEYVSGPYDTTWWPTYPRDKTVTIGTVSAYSFEDLWPGRYSVTVSQSGISDYRRTNSVEVTEITEYSLEFEVLSDTGVNGIDFGLIKPSVLAGDIWHDADYSGVYGGGKSITDASISLVRTDVTTGAVSVNQTDVPVQTFTSGITGLFPGTYTMTVGGSVDASWMHTFTGSPLTVVGGTGSSATIAPSGTGGKTFTVTITDGTGEGVAVNGATVGYAKSSGITTKVFSDNNNNDTDDGETALSGITATLKRLTAGGIIDTGFTAITNSQGTGGAISFPDLLPGVYEVTYNGDFTGVLNTTPDKTIGNSPVSARFTESNRTWVVTIESDDQSIHLPVGVVQPAALSGQVWVDADANGTDNGESAYIAGALTVTLYSASLNGGSPVASTTTNTTDGRYQFTGLYPASDYRVVLTSPSGIWYVTNTGDEAKLNPWQIVSINTTAGAIASSSDFGIVQPISISGRVWEDKDASGADGSYSNPPDMPGADKSLQITGTDGLGNTVTDSSIKTGQDGIYTISDLIPGTYNITLIDASYSNYALSNISSASGIAILSPDSKTWSLTGTSGYVQENCDFALSEYAVIKGTVWHDLNADAARTVSETDMTNIQINIYEYDAGGTYDNTSPVYTGSASGAYIFAEAAIGKYRVELELPSPTDAWGVTNTTSNAVYRDVEITKLGTVHETDFGLAQYVTMAGRIWIEAAGDGTYDAGDMPINNHSVIITRNPGPDQQVLTMTTSAIGIFEVTSAEKLFPGTFTAAIADKAGHVVTNTADGYPSGLAWQKDSRIWSFTLASGGSAADLNCAFAPYAITGYVWKDANGDFVQDQGEAHFTHTDGIKVIVHGTTYSAMVDQYGRFSVEVGGPGNYTLMFDTTEGLPAGYVITNREAPYNKANSSFAVTLTQAQYTGHVDIGAAMGSTIGGMIWLDDDGNGILDVPTDSPVDAGLAIQLIDELGNIEAETTTNANGEYTFTSIKPGNYSVVFDTTALNLLSASGRGFYTGDANNSSSGGIFDMYSGTWSLQVAEGSTMNDISSGFHEPSVITGSLINDNTNTPESGATVVLNKKVNGVFVPWATSTTDANGEYCFDTLLPGEYRVEISLPSGHKMQSGDGAQSNNKIVIDNVDITTMGSDASKETHIIKVASNNKGGGGNNTPVVPETPPGAPNTVNPAEPDQNPPPPDQNPPPPLPAGIEEAVRNTVPPVNIEGLPDGSFVDGHGELMQIPERLVPVSGMDNVFAEYDEDGQVVQYWHKVTVGDKDVFILLDISIPLASPPGTGAPETMALKIILACSLVGWLFIFFIRGKH